jgi:predicted DNA-binding transcriptional regulator AlpA
LTEKQAAQVLGLAVPTLQVWRHRSRGPRYRKIGRAVRYSMDDLLAYAEACAVDPIGR